ncbi:ARM repeat superfamily protein [Wolffia australiana]
MEISPIGDLLEKTRLPQPLLQRSATSAIFRKLRSAPQGRGFDSREGQDAVDLCLSSPFPAVVDQSVRELCFLVTSKVLKVGTALVELQSALEGCDVRFVGLFVKGIGFLCRSTFLEDFSYWQSQCRAVELHPFVKILSGRGGVQEELRRQVLLFILHNKAVRMEKVSEFIRPFLVFSILTVQSSAGSLTFAKDLVSDIASLSCSLSADAIPIMKLLTGCLEYFPRGNDEEFRCLTNSSQSLLDAYEVVLKQLVKSGMITEKTENFRVEILEKLLFICMEVDMQYRWMPLVELLARLIAVQRDLGLPYLPQFSSISISLSVLLCQAEFEHEQLIILKILAFLRQWMTEGVGKKGQDLPFYNPLELLQIFPAINVLSSTSEAVKVAVVSFLSTFETTIVNFPSARKKASAAPTRCKLGSVLLRLLEHFWTEEKESSSGIFFLQFVCEDKFQETPNEPALWLHHLRYYCSVTAQQLKLNPPFHHERHIFSGESLLLCVVASTFLFCPQLITLAIDSLSSLSSLDPKYNLTLLLGNLFYLKVFSSSGIVSAENLIKLLELLPHLVSSSAMVPIVLQIIMPMLQEDGKSVLHAMAVRLLCKMWIVSDRVFGTLQTFLEPKVFSTFASERDVCLSIAASIRDVCRYNPDKGVDLILSVSSCIENSDSNVQALGLEAVAYLCEADVIDFYTAWVIIEKHLLDYSEDHVIAVSLCGLLRWGAVDAEASPEASVKVIQILWQVSLRNKFPSSQQWVRARISALQSLKYFEVDYLLKVITDLPKLCLEFLVSEDNLEIQRAMELLVVRIVNFEHMNRRRTQKDRKPVTHKVEKILDIFPHAMFSTGTKQKPNVGELPGASLLFVTLSSKDPQRSIMCKDASKLHAKYEAMMLEVAESLHLGRNIFVALLALQSWTSFLSRWLREVTVDTMSANAEESSKSAAIILKILLRTAEESIPRVAENVALAIGALCAVLPPSGFMVLSKASNFLLKWLFQNEHEHRQWSAALSLGLVSTSLHVTDNSRKVEIVTALLKVVHTSRSYLVKGACGTGLGLTCQTLSQVRSESEGIKNEKLVGQILRSLSSIITQMYPSLSDSMMSLCANLTPDNGEEREEAPSNLLTHDYDETDDFWCPTGLVLGLGNVASALYTIGDYDTIKIIKNILLSWMPLEDKVPRTQLPIGSCIVLPTVVNFCERAEMSDTDLSGLIQNYTALISRLAATKDLGAAHQNLLMASSIGAGSLLSCILNEGLQSLDFDDIRCLSENLRSLYTHPYPAIVQLGGMLGVINAFGGGAANMSETYARPFSGAGAMSKDPRCIRGPILGNPFLEPLYTSLVQEIFVIAKESTDKQIRGSAAWSMSFLRQWWWSHSQNVQVSRSISEDTLTWGLCSWLKNTEANNVPDAIAVASVFRCLSQAPRLPSSSDWVAIIKFFMRYGAQPSTILLPNSLREECLNLSLVHASSDNSILMFLDELSLLSRFGTLELNLQCLLLSRLSRFMELFSASRLEKFHGDLVGFFSSSVYMLYSPEERSILRISFWKGLHQCMIDASDKATTVVKVERCMELLFRLLPLPLSKYDAGKRVHSQESIEAVDCLAVAPHDWLRNLLQVPKVSLLGEESPSEDETVKKVIIMARLVQRVLIPVSELGHLKTLTLNSKTEATWEIILEIVSALYGADISVKRQWMMDAVEISCISPHPTTALQFMGVLSGRCCDYMPLLILSPESVLTDLPLTLPSLLVRNEWSSIAEKMAVMLWESTKRICYWASPLCVGSGLNGPAQIDPSQSSWSQLLVHATSTTCLSLKHHLPLDKKLALASLPLP